jgi:hypothetical protein
MATLFCGTGEIASRTGENCRSGRLKRVGEELYAKKEENDTSLGKPKNDGIDHAHYWESRK